MDKKKETRISASEQLGPDYCLHTPWKINYTFPSLLKAPFCKQTGAILFLKYPTQTKGSSSLEKPKGNWAELTFAKTSGTVTGDRGKIDQ